MKKFNQIYLDTINQLLKDGCNVRAGNSLSVGSNRNYHELLNYSFSIDEPSNRLIDPAIGTFNIYRAIGRFLWLMRGSNSLTEIEYYDKQVQKFSDDGIIIPGSSFGNRIFDSNGINQFQNIVKILSQDNSSRRAAISVFQPYDNNRQSKDIPCLFGLFFHIRENKLHTTIIMRSNNAFRLLPYNLFELSLVAEVMACELNVEAGTVYYQALSMHLYNDDKEQYTEALSNQENSSQSFSDIKLLRGKSQLKSLELLNKLEEKLRVNNTETVLKDFEKNKEVYRRELTEKWFQFYLILLDFHLKENKASNFRGQVNKLITEPYRHYLIWD